jgi:AhpD family alkylhydroperoxidase
MARIQIRETDRNGVPIVRSAGVQEDLSGILEQCPDIHDGLSGFSRALRDHRTLAPRLVELVRLRIAFHNQCRSCMAIRYQDAVDDGLDEVLVCSLERPYDSDELSAAEISALRYADLFATDHLRIDDVVYDDLRNHFTEKQLVELGLNCAICVGIGRLAASWDVVDQLPERFQARGSAAVTPWGSDALVVH